MKSKPASKPQTATPEEMIEAANEIISEYRKAKHPATLDVRDAFVELFMGTIPGFKVDKLIG